jgi:hypothetical protein
MAENLNPTEISQIDKENFESYLAEDLSEKLTDAQWATIKREIEGRVENFLDELLENLVQDYNEGLFDDEEVE